MKIPYVNLKKQYLSERNELLKIIDKTLKKGTWVGGDEIAKFEKNITKLCKTKYCVSLNSGTDALTMALHLVGVKRGDEVITPPNSFIASTAVIVHLGAKPIFVDVKDDQNIDENKIEEKITKKTKAIMPVHLTGRMCNMDRIKKISLKYKIPIIEDCAQSILSKYKNKYAGSWGHIGCFSTHPLKNLNAMGDGGFITTNSSYYYNKIKNLRSHGMESTRNNVDDFGYVSRLDNLQAAILNFRLKNIYQIIEKRRINYEIYKKNLNSNHIYFPNERREEYNTYHTFVIQVEKRDKLKNFLKKKGIDTAIHYPIPIHLQKAGKYLDYTKGSFPIAERQSKKILSLPINQFLSRLDIINICKIINKFYEKN